MWLLYECLLIVAFLLYLPKAFWRRRLPHRGWRMRLGRYGPEVTSRLAGQRSIWIHAVSVGEVLACRPLVRALAERDPHRPVVLSTITPSGFSVAAKQVGEFGVPVYFPLDLRLCVGRALETLRPRVLLLVESELWPMVIRLTKARGIPVVVVNGRVSPRTFRRYRRITPWLTQLVGTIDLFLMQSEADAARIIELGAPREHVRVVGSLKWDASVGTRPRPDIVQATARQLGLNGTERVIVAGSTHRGEEAAVLDAFANLRQVDVRLRLIIAPRHLERLGDVEALVLERGLTVRRCSQTEPSRSWDVGLVDTFGDLPRYYDLAAAVFVGGSLIPHGGQNPLEPAGLGKPVVFGPSMHNFADIVQQLLASQAARQVAAGGELTTAFKDLLTNSSGAQAMGARARELTERSCGATTRTLDALRPFLEAAPPTA
jgi:3-deoxy-D-manno-octulosonic-acid transferase